MDTREALLVDAFADEPMAGNPAGVLPAADGLSGEQMGKIASELGASETVFVREPEDEGADLALRFFSPEQEVELCGHASIAAGAALQERGRLEEGTLAVETAADVIDLEAESSGRIWMSQSEPAIRQVDVDHADLADALGLDVAALRDVGADLPVSRASTGTPWVLVPVNFLEHLSGADPDPAAVADLAESADAIGVYAFTFDTIDAEPSWHARAFAPGAGVPEDPCTGSAAGACGAYLDHHATLETDEVLAVEQGHFVDRPGRLYVDVREGVRVGGRAVTTLEGSLVVPDDESDDILEV